MENMNREAMNERDVIIDKETFGAKREQADQREAVNAAAVLRYEMEKDRRDVLRMLSQELCLMFIGLMLLLSYRADLVDFGFAIPAAAVLLMVFFFRAGRLFEKLKDLK